MSRPRASPMPTSPSKRVGPVHRLAPGHVEVGQNALGDLVADGEHRVETGHGVLKDHPDPAPADLAQRLAAEGEQLGVSQAHVAGGIDHARGRHQLQDGQTGETLPTAGLAHQRERAAALEREAHAVHRRNPARWGRGTRCGDRSTSSSAVMRSGIHGVAQGVADEVGGENGQRDGQRRERRWPTARSPGLPWRRRSCHPRMGWAAGCPRPRNESPASSRMTSPTPSVAATSSGPMALGSRC